MTWWKKPVFWLIMTPFVLLGLLFVINPFLTTASFCPLPTWFEIGHGIFPPIIPEWYMYAIGIIIAEILIGYIWLLLSGLALAAFSTNKRSAKRRLFLSLPFVALLFATGLVWFGNFLLDVLSISYQYSGLYSVFLGGVALFIVLGVVLWLFVVCVQQYRRDDEIHDRWKGTLASALLVFIPAVLLPGLFIIGMGSSLSMRVSSGIHPADVAMSPTSVADSGGTIGLSVGGSKDIDNFRENLDSCYLPAPTDVTYEGLFYDYYFETANETNCTGTFCPQYESAVLTDPFSGVDEHYLSVGLGSNIAEADFERPPLNLVVVLDVSGSMSSPFDRYHYDQFRSPGTPNFDNINWDKKKMQVAKDAISGVADQLRPEDRFGLVTFSGNAQTIAELETIADRPAREITNIVNRMSPGGGTNMEAGIAEGTRLLEALSAEDMQDRENRIIFLTDAQPNTGSLDENDLYQQAQDNAANGLHTTFFGIGVDFNTRLIEAITNNLRGANYFAVHSPEDFQQRLNEEFEYFTAPLAYDVSLSIDGGDYEIQKIYGSPEAASSTDEILRVKTLFPSPTTEGRSRGGVILAEMDKDSNSGVPTTVTASYEMRDGATSTETQEVAWDENKSPSESLRKAVLLSRFGKLMKNWLADEHARRGPQEKTIYVPVTNAVQYYHTNGLPTLEERQLPSRSVRYVEQELSEWERLSRKLAVSEDYREIFGEFLDHFNETAADIADDDLDRERVIIENLINAPNTSALERWQEGNGSYDNNYRF